MESAQSGTGGVFGCSSVVSMLSFVDGGDGCEEFCVVSLPLNRLVPVLGSTRICRVFVSVRDTEELNSKSLALHLSANMSRTYPMTSPLPPPASSS